MKIFKAYAKSLIICIANTWNVTKRPQDVNLRSFSGDNGRIYKGLCHKPPPRGLRMLKLTVELPKINLRHLHRKFSSSQYNKTGVSLSERQAFNHAQVLSTESLKWFRAIDFAMLYMTPVLTWMWVLLLEKWISFLSALISFQMFIDFVILKAMFFFSGSISQNAQLFGITSLLSSCNVFIM